MIREVIELYYKDKCTIIEYEKTVDKITKQTKLKAIETMKDVPCRVIYKSTNQSILDGGANKVSMGTKLLIQPDINIKAGSKIIVEKVTGDIEVYHRSGEPAYYPSHQEVMLELWKEWA